MRFTGEQNQYLWNALFVLLYVVLFVLAIRALKGAGISFPLSVGAFDVTLMTLATYRLIRFLSYDKIFAFVRDAFLDISEGVDMATGEGVLVKEKPPRGPRRTVSDLLDCPWCTGVWAALFVVFFYLWTPYAWLPTFVFAVAGVASMFQVTGNLIGNKAEEIRRRI